MEMKDWIRNKISKFFGMKRSSSYTDLSQDKSSHFSRISYLSLPAKRIIKSSSTLRCLPYSKNTPYPQKQPSVSVMPNSTALRNAASDFYSYPSHENETDDLDLQDSSDGISREEGNSEPDANDQTCGIDLINLKITPGDSDCSYDLDKHVDQAYLELERNVLYKFDIPNMYVTILPCDKGNLITVYGKDVESNKDLEAALDGLVGEFENEFTYNRCNTEYLLSAVDYALCVLKGNICAGSIGAIIQKEESGKFFYYAITAAHVMMAITFKDRVAMKDPKELAKRQKATNDEILQRKWTAIDHKGLVWAEISSNGFHNECDMLYKRKKRACDLEAPEFAADISLVPVQSFGGAGLDKSYVESSYIRDLKDIQKLIRKQEKVHFWNRDGIFGTGQIVASPLSREEAIFLTFKANESALSHGDSGIAIEIYHEGQRQVIGILSGIWTTMQTTTHIKSPNIGIDVTDEERLYRATLLHHNISKLKTFDDAYHIMSISSDRVMADGLTDLGRTLETTINIGSAQWQPHHASLHTLLSKGHMSTKYSKNIAERCSEVCNCTDIIRSCSQQKRDIMIFYPSRVSKTVSIVPCYNIPIDFVQFGLWPVSFMEWEFATFEVMEWLSRQQPQRKSIETSVLMTSHSRESLQQSVKVWDELQLLYKKKVSDQKHDVRRTPIPV